MWCLSTTIPQQKYRFSEISVLAPICEVTFPLNPKDSKYWNVSSKLYKQCYESSFKSFYNFSDNKSIISPTFFSLFNSFNLNFTPNCSSTVEIINM